MKWHHRLGHLNKYFLREMQKHDMIKGIHTKFSTLSFCEGCMLGKQHKMSFPKKTTFRASNVLELIHSNICGPLQTCSINGYYYFATFIDHYSRFTAVYFLKQKSDFFSKFKAYKALVENQTNKKIKTLQSDNGGEYKSQAFMNFCEDHGIARQFTNSYTPEQNGIFERKNRTLVESARSMLQTAKLPNSIWADAIATACHIQNRSFISNLDNITPLTMWCGKIPDLSYLIFFGSPRYAHIPDDICKKLDAKSRKGIFVGYGEQEGVKGYILYDKVKRKYFTTQDVTFNEEAILPINNIIRNNNDSLNNNTNSQLNTHMEDNSNNFMENDIQPYQHLNQDKQPIQNPQNEEPNQQDLQSVSSNAPLISESNYSELQRRKLFLDILNASEISLPEDDNFANDDLVDAISSSTSTPLTTTKCPSRKTQGKMPNKYSDYVLYTTYLENYPSLLLDPDEPNTIQEALNSIDAQKWKEAMDDEYSSLIKNNTWVLVDLPPGRSTVTNKWVLKKKYNAQGLITRYKARLVARGFSQEKGIDYNETFSPVINISSLRILLALTAIYDLNVHQMDVKTAFLYGHILEEIFMVQPEGYINPQFKNKVCKLLNHYTD
jgi:hypothetical protein